MIFFRMLPWVKFLVISNFVSLRAERSNPCMIDCHALRARNDGKLLEESHQIFDGLAAADKLYAAIFADENFCRARTAVVS